MGSSECKSAEGVSRPLLESSTKLLSPVFIKKGEAKASPFSILAQQHSVVGKVVTTNSVEFFQQVRNL